MFHALEPHTPTCQTPESVHLSTGRPRGTEQIGKERGFMGMGLSNEERVCVNPTPLKKDHIL